MSDSLIRMALINMVYTYQDKMDDQALADETFEELCRRFPHHKDLLDLYYMYYLNALRNNDTNAQDYYRKQIMEFYPDTKQAYIVSQPDYFDRLRKMAAEQDSIYEATYKAYTKSDFATVKQNKQYAEEKYPLSPLMPRFLFLNAVAVARTEGQTAFVGELQDMVGRYPESELGAIAKDMLAMMGQGMESQKGGEVSSLSSLREQTAQAEESESDSIAALSDERNVPSVVLLILPQADEQALNRLQYEVALFNFSQFLIRDFDMQKMPILGTGCALRVMGFESMDEAEWWLGLVNENADLTLLFKEMGVKAVPISEQNLPHYKPTE